MIRPHNNNIFNISHTTRFVFLTRLRNGRSNWKERKFKHSFIDTPNLICICGFYMETTNHFFLHCPRFTNERQNLLLKIERIIPDIFRKTNTSITSIQCTENHIFFFQTSWKDGLWKKMCWCMISLVLLGKMVFLFPENMILHLRRKMKDDLSHKIYGSTIFCSNVLKRWSLEKNRTGIRSFLYYLERWYFFSECMFFNWTRNERWFFSRNTRKFDTFSKCSEKMVFWKKSHWNMIFLV